MGINIMHEYLVRKYDSEKRYEIKPPWALGLDTYVPYWMNEIIGSRMKHDSIHFSPSAPCDAQVDKGSRESLG